MTTPPPVDAFTTAVEQALESGSFLRLTLGKYRGAAKDLERVTRRLVTIKGREQLSFVTRHKSRDVTSNVERTQGIAEIRRRLDEGFRSATLLTHDHETQLLFNKRGEATLRRRPLAGNPSRSGGHDREKRRPIAVDRPFLKGLGVTDGRDRVLPSMAAKWKQINRFLEVFAVDFAAAFPGEAPSPRVVDFGCGKGYLTFALHDWLRLRDIRAKVTGIELREELVAGANRLAEECGAEGLTFRAGDIADFPDEPLDVMIALHACDTATDLALHTGIAGGARLLLCAPCCHKEIRPQVRIPDIMRPLLKHGVHLGAEADMLTDSIRALLLEIAGYDVKVFEFISLEHTDRNRMITAVRNERSTRAAAAREELAALKEFYGLRRQTLEDLLGRE